MFYGVIALAAFLLGFHHITSSDVWTLLSAGRWIASHGQVPAVDVFSYTRLGEPWINTPWLFELFVYRIHDLWGITGLVVMKALWVAGIFTFIYWSLRKQGAPLMIAAPLVYLGIWAARFRFLVRPQLVTLALLPVFYFLLRRYADGKMAFRHLLYALLPLEIVWANCHGGVVWSFLLVGAFWIGARPGQRRDLGILFALLVLASLVNPVSWQTVLYGLITGKEKVFTQYIIELWPAAFSLLYYPYWVLLALGVLSFLLTRRICWPSLIIFVVMACVSVAHRRFMGEFTVVAVPVMAMNYMNARWRLPSWIEASAWFRYGLLALVLLTACMGMNMPGWGFTLGAGIEEKLQPKGADEFMRNNGVRGPVFNPMGFGGYLIWTLYPHEKVFIDGRTDVYGPGLLYDEVKAADPDVWRRLEDTWHFNAAVFSTLDPYQRFISHDPDFRRRWALVWFSDAAFMYVKDVPSNEQVVARFRYELLRPDLADLSYLDLYLNDPAQRTRLMLELQRALGDQPDCVLALTSLAYVHDRMGAYAQAIDALARAQAVIPYKGELAARIATIHLKAGDHQQALVFFRKALRLGYADAELYNNMGVAYYQGQDLRRAAHCWKKAVALQPENMGFRSNLMRIKGGWAMGDQ